MRSQFWTSRGLVVVAIVALHGLAATVVLLSRIAAPEAPRAEPMLVTLLNEQRPESIPAPKVPLQHIRLPTPVIPVVDIDVSEEPPVTITVAKDESSVGGTSIMGLMMLSAGHGSTIRISAEGADAEAAVTALVELVAGKFGEEE